MDFAGHTPAAAPGDQLCVAAIQLNSDDTPGQNLERCRELLAAAAARGARLAVLPENFAYAGAEAGKIALAEATASLEWNPQAPTAPASATPHLQTFVRRCAVDLGLWVVAGGFPEQSTDPTKPYNTSLVVAPDGRIVQRYRKIHLFDVDLADGPRFTESAATLAGSEPAVASICGKQMGISICYDLRFPELYRALVRQGAEVLLVSAAFTRETGRDHWHVLLRARAIESQCWVIAAAQWGNHRSQGQASSRVSYGHSLIIDPWGTIVAEASDGVGVVTATLDFELLRSIRARLPCLTHQRL